VIDIFYRKQATKFLLHYWLLEVILFLGVIWKSNPFFKYFVSQSSTLSVRTQPWAYLKRRSPSRDSLSIILSQCLSPRGWTCCTVHFSALVQC